MLFEGVCVVVVTRITATLKLLYAVWERESERERERESERAGESVEEFYE